jgi:effector-binding domain-containing protein
MAAAAEPEHEVSVRRAEEQVVLYTVAHGGPDAIWPAIMGMRALASETGLTPLGPFWLVHLTPPESVRPRHWVAEVRMPVGREAYHVADDLEEGIHVKTVPAMSLAVASMPGRIEDLAPVRRALLAWMAANGCVAAGPMRQTFLAEEPDPSMRMELACPIYGYAELGAPAEVSPPPAGVPEPRTADASIRTHGEQWGVSTEHIGAVEGSGRFDVDDLKESGINTFRIYRAD